MLTYFIIGVLFTLFVDIISNVFETEARLTNFERLVLMVIWPIGMVIFFREFFREMKK